MVQLRKLLNETPHSAFNLGLSRFIFCILILLFVKFRVTYFSNLPEVFWFPNGIFAFFPTLAPPLDLSYLVLLYYITGVFACVGFLSPVTLPMFTVAATFCLGYEYNFVAGSSAKTVLVLALWLIAFSKAGDGFSLDAILKKKKITSNHQVAPLSEYTWPVFAIRIFIVFIWTATGLQKILLSGEEWLSGRYLQGLFSSNLMPSYLADFFGRISSSSLLCQTISMTVIAFELASVLLLFKRTRNLMVLAQIGFTIFNSIVFGTRLHTWLFLNVFLFDFSYLSSAATRLATHFKRFSFAATKKT